jgi:stage V sporulation protein SpoVS
LATGTGYVISTIKPGVKALGTILSDGVGMNSHHVIAIYVLLGHANFAKMMKIVFDIDVDRPMDEFLKWLTTWKGLRMKLLESRLSKLKQLKQECRTLTITTAIDAEIEMIESLLLQTSRAHRLRSLVSRIGNALGAGGVEQVKKALALDNKSLADATDEDVNAVIESFDSQLYQTHRLRSLMSRIGNALGAGGVEQVKKALALDNKSLADATDEDVNAVIESFDSQLYQTHQLNSCRQRIGNALGAER